MAKFLLDFKEVPDKIISYLKIYILIKKYILRLTNLFITI
jgi:hypothetical protein